MLRTVGFCTIGCVLAISATEGSPRTTFALHSARVTSASESFVGATFVPGVAPTVSVVLNQGAVSLSWTPVALSGGGNVQYRVSRTSATGSVDVCTGADAPVATATIVGCTDRTVVADVEYTYSEQPILVRQSTRTWSRPLSVPSATVTAPRIVFGGVGATVSSTGATVVVPYPTGTQVGDVLLLVVVSGRQNAPSAPTGWSVLASVGQTSGNPMRLFVAWRLADSATSITWDPAANGTGATARILRYARANGNTATPVVASTQVVASTGAASTTFTPTPDVTTTASNAHVVSIVAVRSASVPSLVTSRGFVIETADAGSVGVGQGVGVASFDMVQAGSAASPTWGASAGAVWASATLAFR